VIEACRLIIKGELPKAEALAEREPGGGPVEGLAGTISIGFRERSLTISAKAARVIVNLLGSVPGVSKMAAAW